jgi:pilus assembly protein FimV
VFNKDKLTLLKSSVLAVAIAALPMGAHAAGLGRINVLSALGQPLQAEIELTATREESASISAKLASPEAFKKAGIDLLPALMSIRFTLDKRSNGQPFLRLTSDRPINEPFVDMLIELNWASGRLQREYTFLLDPPDLFQKPPVPVAAPVAAPAAAVAAPIQPAPPAPAPTAPPPEVSAPAVIPSPTPAPVAKPAPAPRARSSVDDKLLKKPEPPRPVEKVESSPATHQVKKGDTLGRIANELRPEGVSLDQMLVALFQNNRDAFDSGNMNRLRTGRILSIPTREAVTAVEPTEARKTVVAQAADFDAYRRKLAGTVKAQPVAKDDAPKQAAAGKITPRVEDKAPAAPAKDKLEVSRSEAGKSAKPEGKNVAGRIGAIEEDLVARDRALREANSRIADLEKNLNDLKRLAELKSQGGAALQKQAQQAGKPAPAASDKSVPAEALKVPAAPAIPAVDSQKPGTVTPADQAAKPADTAKPAVEGKPAQPKVADAPPPPPAPAPAPGFLEENSDLVAGGGGILAVLLAYFAYKARLRRRNQAVADTDADDRAVLAPAVQSTMADSTTGQTVDTSIALPSDFSQIPSEEASQADEGVDPVKEADVYMAYGRDAQAEEILVEALRKEPGRPEIHLKLLEIYAGRKSVREFETVARELRVLTAGEGATWEKVQALGLGVDAANPLYSAKLVEPVQDFEPPPPPTVIMPAAAEPVAEGEAVQAVAPEAVEEAPASLDFDLDLGAPPDAPVASSEPVAADDMALDFDLDAAAPSEQAAQAETVSIDAAQPASSSDNSLDFDLGLGAEPTAEPTEENAAEGNAPQQLSVATDETAALAEEPAPSASAEAASVDFDFDLTLPDAPTEAATEPPPAVEQAIEIASMDFEPSQPAEDQVVPANAESADLDFDLTLPADDPPAEPVKESAETATADSGLELPVIAESPLQAELAPAPISGLADISFDLELPSVVAEPETPAPPVIDEVAAVELASAEAVSQELDLPAIELALPAEPAEPVAEPVPAVPSVPDNPEVATKLELAAAYEEMGDKDGARELLNEALNEGSPTQQDVARTRLELLG